MSARDELLLDILETIVDALASVEFDAGGYPEGGRAPSDDVRQLVDKFKALLKAESASASTPSAK